MDALFSAELWQNAPVIWFFIGVVLMLAEFVVPGLVIVFFGLGAWVAAGCAQMGASVNVQLITFLISSLFFIVALRRALLLYLPFQKTGVSDDTQEDFVGTQAVTLENLAPNQVGKVECHGSVWQAVSKTPIEKGQTVLVLSRQSLLLVVKEL